MTRADIAVVLVKVPELNDFGIGLFMQGHGLGKEERATKHRQDQETLLNSEMICTKVCGWLSTKQQIKTINVRHSSHGLKHMAERTLGEYVTNGVFIAAAIHCGFPYQIESDSANVCFGISEKSLKADFLQDG